MGYGTSPLELMASDAMLQGLVYLDQFTYSAAWISGTPTALGANATVPVQIQINGDSDFVAQEVNLASVTVSAGVGTCDACPNLLLTITRAGSGRELMNQAQHVTNITGNYWNGSFPGRLPMPGLFQMNNIITCQLQNLDNVAVTRVDLAFSGFKVFYITNSKGQTGSRREIFHAL